MLKRYYTQFANAVCRVCLYSDGLMFSLFDISITESKLISYGDMLNQCTSVKATIHDKLPAHICATCKEALLNCCKFRQQAEESNAILKQDVRPKVFFNNLRELKFKIEEKNIAFDEPVSGVPGVNPVVLNGGAIGNTLIKKVQNEHHSEWDMEVEYLDEDFIQYSPLNDKKKRKARRMVNKKATDAVGSKIDFQFPASCQNLKVPIPIKVSDDFNDDVESLSKKKKASNNSSRADKVSKKKSGVLSVLSKPKDSVPKEKRKYVCSVCGVLTFTLNKHLLTHAEHRPFKCDHCSKTFIQKGNFIVHMKKHTGTKDQVCDICGAAFYIPKSVKRHKMIHFQEKNYACHLCPKKFYVNCDLNRHLKVHSGYKPFACEDCKMTFNTKHQLQTHQRLHTGEKPYSCEICNMAFTYKVNLNNHVFKVHGVNLKFKSIYKITPDVLSELYQSEVEKLNIIKKKIEISN